MKKNNITVYAIHISNQNVPEQIVNITAMTGGEVFAVDDPQALQAVFKRIDAMRETKLEKTASELLDHFWPVCIAGLSLLDPVGLCPLRSEVHAMVMHAELAAAAVAILAMGAESLHAQRSRRLARLAFGPRQRPAPWAALAPALRVAGPVGALLGPGHVARAAPQGPRRRDIPDKERRHVLIVLDVSPSMRLKDAGPNADQSRTKRVSLVMDSFLERIPVELYQISVVACYNGAKPVVVDTKDLEVVRNIFGDLPMQPGFPVRKNRPFLGIDRGCSGSPIPGSPGARSCSCSPTETQSRRSGCPRCPLRSPMC